MAKQKEETKALATYGEWTPEQMEKEAKEISTGGDFWKAPVGNTSVRFLPPKVGWPSPFVIQYQHFIRMPGVERQIIFCCPRQHAQKPCMSCKRADVLETSGNARDEKMAKQLRPQKRIMANVIVSPKDVTAKVQIWTFGSKVFQQLKAIREDDDGGGNFLDPIKGFNIVVKRVGTGKDDTTYTLIPSRTVGPLANMDWIENQQDLRRQIRLPNEDQQERLLEGEDPRDVWGDARSYEGKSKKGSDDDIDGASVIDVEETPSTPPGNKRTAEDDLFDDEVELE
jgi:hypothetical protein